MFELTGKVAIVTGAAQGIGRAISLELARKGANTIIADLNIQKAKEFEVEIKKFGYQGLAIQVDVRKNKETKKKFKEVIEKFGRIDILVNNAGVLQDAFISDIREKDWDMVIDTNLKGVFNCSQPVIKYMLRQKTGKIVNIASIGGKDGFPLAGVHYSASKAGVMGFTRQLAKQVAFFGINVNAIAPGTTETEMISHRTPAKKGEIIKKIPAGRLGKPEDVAQAVLFLASDEANFITGETIDVCGGLYMD